MMCTCWWKMRCIRTRGVQHDDDDDDDGPVLIRPSLNNTASCFISTFEYSYYLICLMSVLLRCFTTSPGGVTRLWPPQCKNETLKEWHKRKMCLKPIRTPSKVHKNSKTEEKKNNKLPTEHHTITIRQDDTGSEVTSIHICIFTLVSSLILW